MTAATLKRITFAFALLAGALAAHAGDYLPPGALSYEDATLPNGLRLIVQRAHSAPYVSARLVIHSGTDQFSCADRELPHLVEHLLFSANAARSEEEIDRLVTGWGGGINAYTYAEQTDVVLDVHSRFQREALALLAEMVARFDPQADDVAREARVVEHETGVEHTPFRLWWSRQPVTQSAGERFDLAAGLLCAPGLADVRHLHVEDVRSAFGTHYVASNMMLVLVGDLDDQGLAGAREAFGALPTRPAPPSQRLPIRMPEAETFVPGLLSGTANHALPSAWGIAPFHDWEGYYALQLLESWLDERLFHELRSERGVTYTPSAGVDYLGTAMQVILSVETTRDDRDETLRYLRELVDGVRNEGIPEEDFERLRQAILLGMAQEFERIEDRADYLAASAREIRQGGLFDVESFYGRLDYARFRALVARDWPARFVVVDNSPRLAWSTWVALLGGSTALLVTLLTVSAWRRLRRARIG